MNRRTFTLSAIGAALGSWLPWRKAEGVVHSAGDDLVPPMVNIIIPFAVTSAKWSVDRGLNPALDNAFTAHEASTADPTPASDGQS